MLFTSLEQAYQYIDENPMDIALVDNLLSLQPIIVFTPEEKESYKVNAKDTIIKKVIDIYYKLCLIAVKSKNIKQGESPIKGVKPDYLGIDRYSKVALEAIKRDYHCLRDIKFVFYNSESLSLDSDYDMEVIPDIDEIFEEYFKHDYTGSIIKSMSKDVLESISEDVYASALAGATIGAAFNICGVIPEKYHLSTNEKLLVAVYKSNPACIYKYADKSMFDNKSFISKLVDINSKAFIFSSDKLRDDEEFAIEVLKKADGGHNIFYLLSDRLRDNENVVLNSIVGGNCRDCFIYASKRIKSNRDLAIIALSYAPEFYRENIFKYLTNKVKCDPVFLDIALPLLNEDVASTVK